MTELARLQPTAIAPATPAVESGPPSTQALVEWAQSAVAVQEVAQHIVQTSFVPEAFRNKPYEATAAILSGLEVGLSPMAALRSFDVINGTAAPRAITLRAIVQGAGHGMWVAESTKTRAVVRGRRRGDSEIQESVWTLDRARDLGLAGKHNWKAQPGAMLIARATAECARLIASDAILGIPYVYEELADDVDDDPKPAKKRRTAQRAPLTPAPEPDIPEDQPASATARADRPGPEPANRDQLARIHASLNDLGITERADKLAYCSKVIDRDITSSADLNIREASAVIETLNADLASTQDASAEPELDDAPVAPPADESDPAYDDEKWLAGKSGKAKGGEPS